MLTTQQIDVVALSWWTLPDATITLETIGAMLAAEGAVVGATGTVRVEFVAGSPDKIEVICDDGTNTLQYAFAAIDGTRTLDQVTKLGRTWAAIKASGAPPADITPDPV